MKNKYFVNTTADLDLNLVLIPQAIIIVYFIAIKVFRKFRKPLIRLISSSFVSLQRNFKIRWYTNLPSLRYSCWNVKKSTNDIDASVLTKIINLSFRNGCFPDDLKATQFIPNSNKNDYLNKVIISLSVFLLKRWKVLKELRIFKWKVSWKLLKLLERFRKNDSTQDCLINML